MHNCTSIIKSIYSTPKHSSYHAFIEEIQKIVKRIKNPAIFYVLKILWKPTFANSRHKISLNNYIFTLIVKWSIFFF